MPGDNLLVVGLQRDTGLESLGGVQTVVEHLGGLKHQLFNNQEGQISIFNK